MSVGKRRIFKHDYIDNAVHINIQGAVITIPSECDGYLTGS